MEKFNKLCNDILTEANVQSDIYIDNQGGVPQMSIKRQDAKNKKPLDVNNLNSYIKNIVSIKEKKQLSNPFHCQFEYSSGNTKVGGDTIIVNMGSGTDCPSAAANLCELYAKGICYANNQERSINGKVILPSKRRQGVQWKSHTAQEIALSLVAIITELRKKTEIKYVRLNEAGDFGSAEEVKKLEEVVTTVNKILDKPIIFYNYTHRSDLFPAGRNPLENLPNFVLQGSGWRKDMSIKPSQFEAGKFKRKLRPAELHKNKKIAFMIDNCFYALEYSDFKKAKFGTLEEAESILPYGVTKEQIVQCPGFCLHCDQCKTKGKKFIVIVIHGTGSELKSNIEHTTLGMTQRSKKNITTTNNLPLEDSDIIKLYTSIGRNDYDFIDKLYEYFKNEDKAYKFEYADIFKIWDRLSVLRGQAVNTKDAQEKDWISPNKTGKSELKGSIEDYLLKLQKKTTEKDEDVIEESKKYKKLDLTKLTPIQLSNLAVTGMLAKYSQFASPYEFEDVEVEEPVAPDTQNNTPVPATATVSENIFYKFYSEI